MPSLITLWKLHFSLSCNTVTYATMTELSMAVRANLCDPLHTTSILTCLPLPVSTVPLAQPLTQPLTQPVFDVCNLCDAISLHRKCETVLVCTQVKDRQCKFKWLHSQPRPFITWCCTVVENMSVAGTKATIPEMLEKHFGTWNFAWRLSTRLSTRRPFLSVLSNSSCVSNFPKQNQVTLYSWGCGRSGFCLC